MFVGDAFTVFHSTPPDMLLWVGGEFPDNSFFKRQNLLSFIIQPSKSSKTSKPAVKTSKPSKPPVKIIKNIKTCCHLLYSLQKQKPSVKIIKNIKTCCQNIKTIKTCCQNIKTIKTTCQNHQNLLSKHQNHLSKSSKPTVMITWFFYCWVNRSKTSCQKHQNLLSITWLIIPEVPPTPEVPPYTGSPALYRKSRLIPEAPPLYRKSHLIPEVPPTPEVPPLYQKPRPPVNQSFWQVVYGIYYSMIPNIYIYNYFFFLHIGLF